jgi:hypothetical protein
MSTARRQFLATAGSFVLTAAWKGPVDAAMGPNDKFALVIRPGYVASQHKSLASLLRRERSKATATAVQLPAQLA